MSDREKLIKHQLERRMNPYQAVMLAYGNLSNTDKEYIRRETDGRAKELQQGLKRIRSRRSDEELGAKLLRLLAEVKALGAQG